MNIKKLEEIVKSLQGEVIDLERTVVNPCDPTFIEACRVVKCYRHTILLTKIVPAQMRETIGTDEIHFTVPIASIRKIYIRR